jgi:hypothetical protein
MWELRHKVRTLISGMLIRHRPARRYAGRSADWLPPVLGPSDWSAGLMADRSASWYFDRD